MKDEQMIELNFIPKSRITLWKKDLDNEEYPGVLLGYKSFFNLNTIGFLIWKMLDGKHTVADIIEELSEKFKVVYKKSLQKVVFVILKSLNNDRLTILNYDSLFCETFWGYIKKEFIQEFCC